MKQQYLCGIDVGTTGAKTMLFDLQGNVLASAYREYGCTYPKPNWVEQDIDKVLAHTLDTCQEVMRKTHIQPEQVASIALSTQRTTSIFLDKEEKVLKTISWQDNRSGQQVETIAKQITPEEYYTKTGLPLNTTWIITKILWMQDNEPDTWNKVSRVVQLQDFILRHLGADNYYVDYPDACLYGCFDNNQYQWDTQLMQLVGIDKDILPIPTPCATQVGTISQKDANQTGFAPGTPICVGAGDQNSAAVGAGIVTKGNVSVSLGTGGMAIALLDTPYRDPMACACVTSHAILGAYQFEGYQTGAASVFRWFRDEIAITEKGYGEIVGTDPYQLLDEEIASTPVGAKGLVMLPYFASATSPRWNPNARGTIMGLTFSHDRACLARAHLEGITMEQKDILTNMASNQIPIEKIRIIGGATKSPLWNQMQADMYEKNCETLRITDSAVLGAAIMAAVAVGIFNNIPTAVEQMIQVKEVYEPIPENSAIYNEMYHIYCSAYTGLTQQGVFNKIAALQAKY